MGRGAEVGRGESDRGGRGMIRTAQNCERCGRNLYTGRRFCSIRCAALQNAKRKPERDRTILKLWNDGLSSAAIAATYGISSERVCQIVRRNGPLVGIEYKRPRPVKAYSIPCGFCKKRFISRNKEARFCCRGCVHKHKTIVEGETRVCRVCGIEKPIEEYHKVSGSRTGVHMARCKKCHYAKCREHQLAHRH